MPSSDPGTHLVEGENWHQQTPLTQPVCRAFAFQSSKKMASSKLKEIGVREKPRTNTWYKVGAVVWEGKVPMKRPRLESPKRPSGKGFFFPLSQNLSRRHTPTCGERRWASSRSSADKTELKQLESELPWQPTGSYIFPEGKSSPSPEVFAQPLRCWDGTCLCVNRVRVLWGDGSLQDRMRQPCCQVDTEYW